MPALASQARDPGGRTVARQRFALLLQGPVGGFFTALKRGLESQGWRVLKVNFNAGDRLFAGGAGCVPHRGDERGFSDWLTKLCSSDRPDLITLFGDRRPLHRIATDVAILWNIPVWSFEEGYVRPGYVTLERGGNNQHSPLPRTPEAYRAVAAAASASPVRGSSHFVPMALLAIAYSAALIVGRRAFPAYRHHRERSAAGEALAWSRSLFRKLRRLRRSRTDTQRVLSGRAGGYYLVACQVPDDLQVVHHGRGWTVERLIQETVASFARAAPAGTLLVLKAHPLARGHLDHAEVVRAAAVASGCGERVVLIDSGPMAPLARQCLTMVTINSTSGLAALGHGRPVVALGDSFYVIPGLARQVEAAALDSVWSGMEPPDPALWASFRAHMIRTSLMPGDFYLSATWPALVRSAVARLSGLQTDEAGVDAHVAVAQAQDGAPRSAARALPALARSPTCAPLPSGQSAPPASPRFVDASDLVSSP